MTPCTIIFNRKYHRLCLLNISKSLLPLFCYHRSVGHNHLELEFSRSKLCGTGVKRHIFVFYRNSRNNQRKIPILVLSPKAHNAQNMEVNQEASTKELPTVTLEAKSRIICWYLKHLLK